MAGFCEGDTCGRDGCTGVINVHPSENCSCHISPPCHSCTSPRNFCPECGWEEADEPEPEAKLQTQAEKDYWAEWRKEQERIDSLPLDNTKVSWRARSHSSCSMIKEGVYPQSGNDSADREMVRKQVDGTFGGRFESFGKGKFKFIAYTD
ncbi:hypothetical protein [Curvibacter lanceolatus]|uniref:hypothetical protein n=1 Tax=Curvibacter lanceolatus TaxID=86182 RepID=UPI0004CF769F|nr:hypothetical protein [Curvibacter lanceolatus]